MKLAFKTVSSHVGTRDLDHFTEACVPPACHEAFANLALPRLLDAEGVNDVRSVAATFMVEDILIHFHVEKAGGNNTRVGLQIVFVYAP